MSSVLPAQVSGVSWVSFQLSSVQLTQQVNQWTFTHQEAWEGDILRSVLFAEPFDKVIFEMMVTFQTQTLKPNYQVCKFWSTQHHVSKGSTNETLLRMSPSCASWCVNVHLIPCWITWTKHDWKKTKLTPLTWAGKTELTKSQKNQKRQPDATN